MKYIQTFLVVICSCFLFSGCQQTKINNIDFDLIVAPANQGKLLRLKSDSETVKITSINFNINAYPMSVSVLNGKVYALLLNAQETNSPVNGLYEINVEENEARMLLSSNDDGIVPDGGLVAFEEKLYGLSKKGLYEFDPKTMELDLLSTTPPRYQSPGLIATKSSMAYSTSLEHIFILDLQSKTSKIVEMPAKSAGRVVGFSVYAGIAGTFYVSDHNKVISEIASFPKRTTAPKNLEDFITKHSNIKEIGDQLWGDYIQEVPGLKSFLVEYRSNSLIVLNGMYIYDYSAFGGN